MERIREALQRARQERNFERVGFVDRSPPGVAVPDEQKRDARKIIYAHTSTVDVPSRVLAEHRIVSGFEPSTFTDAFKILSTQVSHKLREHRWNTLGVTSPGEHEGKTLVAANLAISLAAEFHQTALLVDADLRQPDVRETFGLPPGPGLSDYLLSTAPVETLLVHPGIQGLVVLPGGTPLINSTEMLGSRRMAQLVKELKERYTSRIVVFDLPPLLPSADVLAFAPHLDAALLVVEEGKTRQDDVRKAADLLASTALIGTVLNRSSERLEPYTKRRGSPPSYDPHSEGSV